MPVKISHTWFSSILAGSLPVLLYLCCFTTLAQEPDAFPLSYARGIVDTLSSPSMHGRGYYKNGDKLAASYIGTQFSGMKLKWSYQDVPVSIVSFPKKISCSLDQTDLEPGKEFIADAGCRTVKGTFPVEKVDSSIALTVQSAQQFISRDLSGKALLLLHEKVKNKELKERLMGLVRLSNASLIIFADERLTHSVAVNLEEVPAIHVLQTLIRYDLVNITVNIRSKVLKNYPVRNVIAQLEGRVKDSFVVYAAHYDHLGRMGPEVYFPGANDNASGVAMLMCLARHYAKNPPHYSILFIAFGGEEAGLVGSRYYTQHPTIDLAKVKFMINFDILGTGDEGITVVNATRHETDFKQLQLINAQHSFLKEVKPRGPAANSDHYWFAEKGIPAFFIYTLGGIKAYHDVHDRRETLPLTEFSNLFLLLLSFHSHLEP
ncbi:MAG: M20/M25/M40 family metallo-hydrolase [Bacteroidia bacterium]|nr:M20/M25/M40 family metallo-hydrolase [Bacteroidia bacterium]